eukprot:6814441-Prymnesium_polylepis.1
MSTATVQTAAALIAALGDESVQTILIVPPLAGTRLAIGTLHVRRPVDLRAEVRGAVVLCGRLVVSAPATLRHLEVQPAARP